MSILNRKPYYRVGDLIEVIVNDKVVYAVVAEVKNNELVVEEYDPSDDEF